MFKQKKIPCYVLVFDQFDIIKDTLEFLARSSEKLDIVVIENPSNNSPKIKAFIEKLGSQKHIKRYYLFDENITNNAMGTVLKKELRLIKKSPYVIFTDGDLHSPDTSWLEEEVAILKNNPDVLTCGITLDMSNLPLKTFPNAKDWIPEDKKEYPDYYETFTGSHLQITRGKELYDFLKWSEKTQSHLVDGTMHHYCYEVAHKKWARTKNATARHLTWDLYSDLNHPYTKLKLGKSFEDTWHHKKTSSFVLRSY